MANLDIDKEEFNNKFIEEDWNYVFKKTKEIVNFILETKYKMVMQDKKEDIIQECLESLWKKIVDKKITNSKNLFSYAWKSSNYRIMEILRKKRTRNDKLKYIDILDENIEYMEILHENRERSQVIL